MSSDPTTRYPAAQVEDSHKLQADAYVDLFEITFVNGSFLRLTNDLNRTWRGLTYEGTAIKITGIERYGDEKETRPQMSLRNPDGLYASFIKAGILDYAVVKRIRVLKQHLDANLDIKQEHRWRIWRVVNLSRQLVQCELRSQIDRFNSMIPARRFSPPDFPMVTLQ